MPGIFNASLVDTVLDIHQQDAEKTMRQLAVGRHFPRRQFGRRGSGRVTHSPRKSLARWWWRSSAIAAIVTFPPACSAENTLAWGGI